MHLTQHSVERGSERTGLNPKAFQRLAGIALERGRRPAEFRGRFRRFLDGLYLRERNADNVRVHGEYVYLFHGDVLITVIPVPHKLKNGL